MTRPLLALLLCLCGACDAPARAQDTAASPAQDAPAHDAPRAPQAADAPSYSPAPERPDSADKGIYADLDAQVRLVYPAWLEQAPALLVRVRGHQEVWALVQGVPVALADASWGPVTEIAGWGRADSDGDGIPDQMDLLIGAKKAALAAAPYIGGYKQLAYPNGDVPRGEGVCTDVIIRAARNAGEDLQVSLHEDIKANPKAFPMVKKPDPNIDQRRVKTLLPHFKRRWRALSADPRDLRDPWLPGDVVFMNTLGDERPDHLGVVSDRRGVSGFPLIINSWDTGHTTAEQDLLAFVPVTHRFRPAHAAPKLPDAQRGLDGLLARAALSLPPDSSQLLLVTALAWDAPVGLLRRYKRGERGWQPVGQPIPIYLGQKGLGRGRGLHGDEASGRAGRWSGPVKREGDGKSPAGVFALGDAFGLGDKPYKGAWPWRAVSGKDRFVDDPKSPHYNTWQVEGQGAWASAEALSMYPLGLVVHHNTSPVSPGAGSAIFLHPHLAQASPTIGCTAMDTDDLTALLAWLDPSARPVLVQTAEQLLE